MIRCPKLGEANPHDWLTKGPKSKGLGLIETIIRILTGNK